MALLECPVPLALAVGPQGGSWPCSRLVARGGFLLCYRFILGAGFEVRPVLVLVVGICFGWSFGFGLLGAFLFVFFVVCLFWFAVVMVMFLCGDGSHVLHFHASFGLFVWFWNCICVRFVHFRCVHFWHSVHSMDCWFILHCFVQWVHGYLFVFVIGFGSSFSICSSIVSSFLAISLVDCIVEFVANMSSLVTLVVLSLCTVVHSFSMCSWVSMALLQNLHVSSLCAPLKLFLTGNMRV